MTEHLILLTNETDDARLERVIRYQDATAELQILTSRQDVVEILEEKLAPETLLVSFSTGVIVPRRVLDRLARPAYNFHAASPEYPGRDAHHFAVYYGARCYGATAHEMEPQVDSGRIVGVEWFDVAPGTTPQALRCAATEAAFGLYQRLMPRMMRRERLPDAGVEWSARKWTRKDFLAMCRIDPSIDREEFERRYFAFDGGAYDNLTLELHGRIFRIDRSGRT